ncbi:MAG: hypothetical protein DRG39_03230 [Deltaproteobacteria bacterium]|nr:MAG: hypothetical protein DRG39_03230 [Deltaproteobacteria bacterium]
MPRPKKPRLVQGPPVATVFVPNVMPPWGKKEILLPVECFEAIRLVDFQGLDHEAAAKMMNVSRQTFGRILTEARTIIADALVMGKVLRIEGGNFVFPPMGGRRYRHRWRGGKF